RVAIGSGNARTGRTAAALLLDRTGGRARVERRKSCLRAAVGWRAMADQGDDVIDRASALPPRWAEYVLRLMLHRRDRAPISCDLLEEYREVALPALGSARASLWYLKQVGSIMT